MLKKVMAIFFIFLCTSIAWMILGGTVLLRTNNSDSKLDKRVENLWGSSQQQKAPRVYTKKPGRYSNSDPKLELLPLNSSDIHVGLNLDHRKKGLLWYSTYKIGFKAKYEVKNTLNREDTLYFEFNFPSSQAIYSDFEVISDGKPMGNMNIESGTFVIPMRLKPGETRDLEIVYKSQGVEDWWYNFGYDVNQINNFTLVMTTDFDKIDFPENSISPSEKKKIGKGTEKGWELTWKYNSLLTGAKIGMAMPKKLNPGPWASKVIFFAPVSLFFFFFILFIISAIREINIHPINYFFLGTAFFSFHLLLAYLVDHLSIPLSFILASAVSIFLVITYMRLVVNARFAFLEVGLSQLIFLVVFSFTFFFEGYTGLSITIMSIITLFVIMQLTAKVDWKKLNEKKADV